MQLLSYSVNHDRLRAKLTFCGVLLALATASSGCSKSNAAPGGDAPKDKPQAAAAGLMPARATDPTGPVITPPGLTKSTLKASDYPTAKANTRPASFSSATEIG